MMISTVKTRLIFTICMQLLTYYHTTDSRIGCIDTSRHLTVACDTKRPYFDMECTCPCEVTASQHNRCIRCNHTHYDASWSYRLPQERLAWIKRILPRTQRQYLSPITHYRK